MCEGLKTIDLCLLFRCLSLRITYMGCCLSNAIGLQLVTCEGGQCVTQDNIHSVLPVKCFRLTVGHMLITCWLFVKEASLFIQLVVGQMFQTYSRSLVDHMLVICQGGQFVSQDNIHRLLVVKCCWLTIDHMLVVCQGGKTFRVYKCLLSRGIPVRHLKCRRAKRQFILLVHRVTSIQK